MVVSIPFGQSARLAGVGCPERSPGGQLGSALLMGLVSSWLCSLRWVSAVASGPTTPGTEASTQRSYLEGWMEADD